jgi:hypothetical protein
VALANIDSTTLPTSQRVGPERLWVLMTILSACRRLASSRIQSCWAVGRGDFGGEAAVL